MSPTTSYIRVLVVDDHELTRFTLKLALKRHSFIDVVGVASNGKEALDQVQQQQPDLIVLDLHMPVMDGWTASKHIKEAYPHIKIVAYSSVEGGKNKVISDGGVIDAFCEKATCTKSLIETINAIA